MPEHLRLQAYTRSAHSNACTVHSSNSWSGISMQAGIIASQSAQKFTLQSYEHVGKSAVDKEVCSTLIYQHADSQCSGQVLMLPLQHRGSGYRACSTRRKSEVQPSKLHGACTLQEVSPMILCSACLSCSCCCSTCLSSLLLCCCKLVACRTDFSVIIHMLGSILMLACK